MKIGVFDSGVGGKSVAQAIQKALPEHVILLREDKQNVPYGTKSPTLLLQLVTPILQEMIDQGCSIIVIACNTVTTTLITDLRERSSVPLIGMEPMVKPAAELSTSSTIAVFATPTTLSSERYNYLKSKYCEKVAVIEPDCSNWSQLIEDNTISKSQIQNNVEEVIRHGADVLVLGCTHYHWIEQQIKDIARGRATVLQPEQPVIEQLKREIARIG